MYENPTADRLVEMRSVEYAHFSALGTWEYEREPCKICGWHWQTIVPPLLVQWEPSTDVTGDVSWDGPFGYTFVVRQQVAKALNAMHFDCSFLPVEYVKPERKRNTVPFPYRGPRLLWGRCSASVELDMAASAVTLESSCSACGDVRYTFRNKGIVIRPTSWKGQKMFRITTNGRSGATFVTEEARRLLEGARFSNISFSEAGQILQ
jgi:hypothetical protein